MRPPTKRYAATGRTLITLFVMLAASVLSPYRPTAQTTQVVSWGRPGHTNVPPALTNAIAIAAKGYFSVALRADGSVAQWGNGASDPGVSNLVSITSGWLHALGLRADGSAVGWGENYLGETIIPADATNLVALAASYYFSLGLRADGTVMGWGDNPSGVLDIPASLSNVVAIAAGGYHVLALRADGSVVGWGTHPEPAGLSNVVAIAVGDNEDVALLFDGTVISTSGSAPVDLTNVTAIAAGGDHALALRSDGTVAAWGCSCYGSTEVPPDLTNVVALAAAGSDGYDHSVALIGLPSPPAPVLNLEAGNGFVRIQLSGEVRRPYVLEAAAELSPNPNWTFQQNILLTNTLQQVLALPVANAANRFYRARLLP